MIQIALKCIPISIVCSLALASCAREVDGEEDSVGDRADAMARTTIGQEPLATGETVAPTSAMVLFEGSELGQSLRAAEGLVISETDAGVLVSGRMLYDSTGGRTSGAFIELPASFASEVTNNLIIVTFVARSIDGAELQTAYSTNQVGNSGWQNLALTDQFSEVRFQYHVPDADEPNPDFLGIAPVGGEVEITSIRVAAAEIQ